MALGIVFYILMIFIPIYARTFNYVDEEHRDGMKRLLFVVLGSVVLAIGIIYGIKFILSSL